MKTINFPNTFKAYQLIALLIIVPFLFSFTIRQEPIPQPPKDGPLEVDVTLRVNKIYNINSVHETYQIDGYLIYTWVDERVRFTAKDSLPTSLIYENENSIELMKNDVWIPAFELINVQGSGETPNVRIEIHSDGTIELEQRFFDTFSSDMDYKKFPFDAQNYLIKIEAFSYGISEIVFKNPKIFLDDDHHEYLGEDWEFIKKDAKVITKQYQYMNEDKNSIKNSYSRVVYNIEAKRLSGYYQWQVLFPLLIIILASFAIFWIEEFATQIGVGFTLMLTVVAFNFYSASILPKLSYNTFIEYVIIVGYIFIFLGIIAVIINHRVNDVHERKNKIPLQKHFRYLFPIVYTIIMVLFYAKLLM